MPSGTYCIDALCCEAARYQVAIAHLAAAIARTQHTMTKNDVNQVCPHRSVLSSPAVIRTDQERICLS